MNTKRGLCFVLAALLACVEAPAVLDNEGDPCRTLERNCVGDHTLLRCEAEQWTSTSCDEICAATGPGLTSLGCEPKGINEDDCACAPPPGGCEPGAASCASEDQLDLCTLDWEWTTLECDEGLISLGCVEGSEGAACSCSAEGSSCTDELPRCVDEETLAHCEAGTWTYRDCSEECGGSEAKCDPSGSDGPSCECG